MRGLSLPGDYNTRLLLLVNGHKINDNVYDHAPVGAELGLDVALFDRVERHVAMAGPAEVPIRIVLHGLHGPITVKHEPYVGTMAALGDLLDDRQIAAVLTYVRASWGNRASAVTEAEVAAVRAASAARAGTPYRAAELEGMLGTK